MDLYYPSWTPSGPTHAERETDCPNHESEMRDVHFRRARALALMARETLHPWR